MASRQSDLKIRGVLSTREACCQADSDHEDNVEDMQSGSGPHWITQLGSSLVQSVSVHMGGDSEQKWYCKDCGHDHGATDHPPVCNAMRSVYNEERSFEVIAAAHDRYFADFDSDRVFSPLSKEKFWELEIKDDGLLSMIMEDQEVDYVYDEYPCACTEFEFGDCEGILLDKVNGDHLGIWEELIRPRP